MTPSFSFTTASFSFTVPRSSSVVFVSSCVLSSSAAIVASFSSRAWRSSPTRRSSVVAFTSEACFCFWRAESFLRFALTALRISSISAFSSSRFCAPAVLPSSATAIEVLTALSSLTRRSSRLRCTSSSVDCISAVAAPAAPSSRWERCFSSVSVLFSALTWSRSFFHAQLARTSATNVRTGTRASRRAFFTMNPPPLSLILARAGSDRPGDRLADFFGARAAAQVRRVRTFPEDVFDRVEHGVRGLAVAEKLEHHRARPDLADRVRDVPAHDVGRRAVDRLEQRGVLSLRIQVRRRRDRNRARARGPEIREDVSEEVRADDDVEPVRVPDEMRGQDVDVVLVGPDVGVFLRDGLGPLVPV